MFYIYSVGFLFLLSYFFAINQINRQKIYYIILLILFIFTAFRYQVGCDWTSYENIFTDADYVNLTYILNSREPIFWMIIMLFKKMNFSYIYFNVIFSAIFFIGIHTLAKKQPDPLSFLILMFPILIINIPMSGIRQGAAIGLICIALAAFVDRRPLYYLIWVALATCFHSSAIIFVLLVPFASGRFNNTRLAIMGLFTIPCLFSFYFLDSAQWALSTYVGTGLESYGAAFRIFFLVLSGMYFYLCLKNKWLQTFPKDYSLVSLGSIGMVMIVFLLPISTIISDRFGYYLIPIQAIIFARIPYLPFKSNHSLNCALPYLGLFLVFFAWTKMSWHFKECYVPYDNLFF
tara:strand:+ start:58868 stop:59908 length:1041 start_codon:yes stop_codon:yes gene_type:complete